MTNLKLYVILIAFLLIGIIFTYNPIHVFIQLMQTIQSQADKIAFDKGAYYLFGGGLLFTVGPLWVLFILSLSINNPEATKKLSTAKAKSVQRVVYAFFWVCLASTFILPHVMSIGVGNYLENRGYTYCDKLSRQWLFNRTMVYTKNTCTDDNSSTH